MCQGGLNYTQVLFIQFDVLGKSVSALNGCKNDLYIFNGNNLMVIKQKCFQTLQPLSLTGEYKELYTSV